METRSSPRQNITLKIESKISEESAKGFALACGGNCTLDVVDVSASGVGITSKYFLPTGLVLDLSIPGELFGLSEAIKVRGEIRHCRFVKDLGYSAGIKFLNISDTHRQAIARFVEEHERRKSTRIKLSD